MTFRIASTVTVLLQGLILSQTGDKGAVYASDEEPTLTFVGNNGPPGFLNKCEGDCDKDDECAGDLECFFRGENNSPRDAPVPGCAWGLLVRNGLDFCYDPKDSSINTAFNFSLPPSLFPSNEPLPSGNPSTLPTAAPSASVSPSSRPSGQPSTSTNPSASVSPTTAPSLEPSVSQSPTATSSLEPSVSQPVDFLPAQEEKPLSYEPGKFTEGRRSTDNLLRLSNGLSAKPIAQAGQRVELAGGGLSSEKFHKEPDGAAVFEKKDGGWYYTSNAENNGRGSDWDVGGVGSIEFNKDGEVVGYKKVATNTRKNCGGGATSWGSWVTCEELTGGRVYQVDPSGSRDPMEMALKIRGRYESFAYDEGTSIPTYYVTADESDGMLTRFTPDDDAMECFRKSRNEDRWCALSSGEVDYLLLSGGQSGTFSWTKKEEKARIMAEKIYPMSEGIDIKNGMLYMVSKKEKRLVELNLRNNKYSYSSTRSGAFDRQPDQVARIMGDDSGILYFCEDGGDRPGIFGRDTNARYFTVLYGELDYDEETTGLAWSPDKRHMYVTIQTTGKVYDITRDDGRKFDGAFIDIKYHAS